MRRPDPIVTMRRQSAGFSLLELLVVLAIAGVLYAVAVPHYQQYVMRSHRSQAQALLVDAAARQARHYAQHHVYITHQADLGQLRAPGSSTGAGNPASRYRLTVEDGPGGYRLQAEPLGAQHADTACGSLWLDGLGNQGSNGTAAVSECWK